MASKKEIFIQQLDILDTHLKKEENGVLHVDHFKNDIELLILMMHYLIKDIKTTRHPLTRLLELQKSLETIELATIDYLELKPVLLKAFKNTEDIKERIKLGCLNINTDHNENIKKYLSMFEGGDISSIGLLNFVKVILNAFEIDLDLVDKSKNNDYSESEIKKLSKLKLLNEEMLAVSEKEQNENKKLGKMRKLIEKNIDLEWLTKISEY